MLSILVLTTSAVAQERAGPIQVGPLGLKRSFRITNLGIDTNVFNDPEDPRQDTTVSFVPELESVLTLGGTRLKIAASANLTYFHRFASQRSLGTNDTVRWDIPINRFQPYVSYTFNQLKARPNLEIDTRATHRTSTLLAGTAVRLASRALVGIEVRRGRTSFDEDAAFLGMNLSSALDRSTETLATKFEYELTPLTRFRLIADTERERFDDALGRGSRSITVKPGFEFAPTALIRGTAVVGYRRFDISDPAVPDFSGPTASVDIAYTLRGATQFAVRAERDVAYSVFDLQPYYVLAGGMLTATQRLTDAWDVSVNVMRQRQTYRQSTAPAASVPDLLLPTGQTLRSYGGGVGYRLGATTRLGFQVERFERQSSILPYRTVRAFASVSYGL
jgi:hypothetical protein